MGTEMTNMEAEIEELIQTYGCKIREVGVHRDLARERDKVSNDLRRAKSLNHGTTRDTNASSNRAEGGRNNLKGLALPKCGGKLKKWPDFRRSFSAILGMCSAGYLLIR